MSKVTRQIYSKNINRSKYLQLKEIAVRLGKLRKEIWHRYGSVNGTGKTHMQIRDEWLSEKREFDVPARLWKATLKDTMQDIKTGREACKVNVRKDIHRRTNDEEEKKELYTLLKYDKWMINSYLSRKMRKYFKHGKTNVDNQILLDTESYTIGKQNGVWLNVQSLEKGNRISIPLNSSHKPTGTLRLILNQGIVEIHYTVEASDNCSCKPCGNQEVGVDKGYTEVFTDSDKERHGESLGDLLSKESDYLKQKYARRNKIKVIANNKPHKMDKIYKNNLGRKKLDDRKRKHTANVRDKVFKATHSVVDKAHTVVCEDLTKEIKGKSYGKNQNRRLSAWVKGLIAEALNSVTERRCSTLVYVPAAYTSQTDSRYGALLGNRKGDLFYCFDGVVLDADHNAAQNILSRLNDPDIGLYTSYKKIREILEERTEQFRRLGLLNQDSSCSDTEMKQSLSTESELPCMEVDYIPY